jgi:hypothetical protein
MSFGQMKAAVPGSGGIQYGSVFKDISLCCDVSCPAYFVLYFNK